MVFPAPLNVFPLFIISFTRVVNMNAFPHMKIFDFKKKSALVTTKTARYLYTRW